MRRKRPFHCDSFWFGCMSRWVMFMTENRTSIQPSRETISKRIRIDSLKESNDQVLSVRPGFDQTLGERNVRESSTGAFP